MKKPTQTIKEIIDQDIEDTRIYTYMIVETELNKFRIEIYKKYGIKN